MDITSRQNERVRHAKKLGSSGEYRRETGLMLCEGRKLFGEAIKSGVEISEVFTCGDMPGAPAGARVYSVPRDIIEYISPMKTPQDILFTASIPQNGGMSRAESAIILESIQDPGNVGTVIRTANAFGVEAVILLGDCADPWSTKTLRATMGAAFRQSIIRAELSDLRSFLAEGVPVYAAALSDRARDIRSVSMMRAAVCIGNEGNGLTKELIDACDGEIIIPMGPDSESLNAAVAASVCMWEMARNRE